MVKGVYRLSLSKKIKNVLRIALIKSLILLGKNDSESFVLAYHEVNENDKLKPAFFEYQIRYYLKKGYTFISNVEELNKSKRILITFDDAYASFKSIVLPTLSKYNIPCILFVPTKYLGKKLIDGISKKENQKRKIISKKDLRVVSQNKLVIIGCHTHSHLDVNTTSYSFVREDVQHSKKIIERLTGEKCIHFCYPQGRVNKIIVNIIQGLGFKYAFTAKQNSFKVCKDYLRIPRYTGDYFLNKDFLDLSRSSNCGRYMRWFA